MKTFSKSIFKKTTVSLTALIVVSFWLAFFGTKLYFGAEKSNFEILSYALLAPAVGVLLYFLNALREHSAEKRLVVWNLIIYLWSFIAVGQFLSRNSWGYFIEVFVVFYGIWVVRTYYQDLKKGKYDLTEDPITPREFFQLIFISGGIIWASLFPVYLLIN